LGGLPWYLLVFSGKGGKQGPERGSNGRSLLQPLKREIRGLARETFRRECLPREESGHGKRAARKTVKAQQGPPQWGSGPGEKQVQSRKRISFNISLAYEGEYLSGRICEKKKCANCFEEVHQFRRTDPGETEVQKTQSSPKKSMRKGEVL